MALRFTVHDISWTADGVEFPAGENEVENPSAELTKLAGSAHAAGVIEVEEGLDVSHVQSQEDGEAAYEAAQADGSWQEGNELQHALDVAARDAETADAQTIDAGDVASASEVLGEEPAE